MDRGIYVAATGAINAVRNSDVIANNLAGSSAAGFKKDTPIFSIYQIESNPSLYRAVSTTPERVFVSTSGGNIYTNFEQGAISKTGNPLDFAIAGDGFFAISTANGERYTRRGDFIINKDGGLKTKDGNDVLGENGVITLTQGDLSVSDDGSISINGNRIDRFKIVTFSDLSNLQKTGNGLFKADIKAVPLVNPSIMQGNLEMSNVNTIREMVSMIDAMRAYESHMKAVRGFDEITDSVIRLTS